MMSAKLETESDSSPFAAYQNQEKQNSFGKTLGQETSNSMEYAEESASHNDKATPILDDDTRGNQARSDSNQGDHVYR